jgi:cholesterol oxidase
MASFDYDVVIIGSGFGGSVAAVRAVEKGYRAGVMESGRRWKKRRRPADAVGSAELLVASRGGAVCAPRELRLDAKKADLIADYPAGPSLIEMRTAPRSDDETRKPVTSTCAR